MPLTLLPCTMLLLALLLELGPEMVQEDPYNLDPGSKDPCDLDPAWGVGRASEFDMPTIARQLIHVLGEMSLGILDLLLKFSPHCRYQHGFTGQKVATSFLAFAPASMT